MLKNFTNNHDHDWATKSTLMQMPEWADLLRAVGKVDDPSAAYAAIALCFRAINLRCDTLTGVPCHVEDAQGNEVDWPFPAPLDALLWSTEAGMLLFGHGEWLLRGLEKQLTATTLWRKITDVYWLSTRYTTYWYDPALDMMHFTYTHPGPLTGQYLQNQLVYFREFNPIHNYLPGPSATYVALSNLRLTHYLTQFATAFFEGGAMPAILLSLEKPGAAELPAKEKEEVQNFFNRGITSAVRAFRLLVTRYKFNAQVITPPFKDMVIPELYERAQQETGKAFGIPQTILDEATNKASQGDDWLMFYNDTIIPRCKKFASFINRQLLSKSGLTLVFDFKQLSVFQTNELERDKGLLIKVQAGMPFEIAARIAGYEFSDDEIELIKQVRTIAKPSLVVTSEPAAGEVIGDGQTAGSPVSERAQTAAAEEAGATAKMMRKSINALKAGKSPAVDFVSDDLSPERVEAIKARLAGCKSESEIREAFAQRQLPEPAQPQSDLAILAIELKRANDLLEQSK